MDRFILKATLKIKDSASDGYYTGNSYIYQGYKYAIVDKDIEKAKTYSSYLRAISAKRQFSFENYDFEVCRLSEESSING